MNRERKLYRFKYVLPKNYLLLFEVPLYGVQPVFDFNQHDSQIKTVRHQR